MMDNITHLEKLIKEHFEQLRKLADSIKSSEQVHNVVSVHSDQTSQQNNNSEESENEKF